MISEDIVKEIAGRDTPTGEMTVEACIATELLELRADAKTSQNHNAAVIDRIVDQLREAGYTGTLSEMVDHACELKEFSNYVEGGA